MTTTYPQVVKAWHYHKVQDDFITCVKGMLKLVLYDDREGSPTRGEINEFFLGDYNPVLVKVPKMVYHGWKCISPRRRSSSTRPRSLTTRRRPTNTGWTPITTIFLTGGREKMDNLHILVTGGCGFIGSNFIRYLLSSGGCTITNLDKLTYAGNLENLKDLEGRPRIHVREGRHRGRGRR